MAVIQKQVTYIEVPVEITLRIPRDEFEGDGTPIIENWPLAGSKTIEGLMWVLNSLEYVEIVHIAQHDAEYSPHIVDEQFPAKDPRGF